jgi:hypothetical protein
MSCRAELRNPVTLQPVLQSKSLGAGANRALNLSWLIRLLGVRALRALEKAVLIHKEQVKVQMDNVFKCN